MMNCEHCRETLLEYVYGLLDGEAVPELQAHLESCADCRSALAKAQEQQKLMARAALAIKRVPEFTLPTEAPATMPAETAIRAESATLPYPQAPATKKSLWRRPWVAWVTAAAIVFVLASPVVWYRSTVERYQGDVAATRKTFKDIDQGLAVLPVQYEREHRLAMDTVHAKAVPHLHVVGPKTLEPNAKAHLDITTRHPEGELLACHLTIKVLEANDVIKVVRLDSEGHVRVEIDAAGAKPNTPLRVMVEAATDHATSSLHETIHVQAPSFVTRLDTNKLLYQSRDVLFFRVLVLDRFTLQPPSQPVAVRIALIHNKKSLRTLEHKTGAGGVLAAEFAVEEGYPEGSYTLEVSPFDADKAQVQATSVPLEIVREIPGIRLHQDRYAAGTPVTGELIVRGNQPVPNRIVGKLDGKPIDITLQPQPAAPGGGGIGGAAFKAKKETTLAERSFRFSTPPIPPSAAKGADQLRLTMPLATDKKAGEFGTIVPLVPTEFAIDFFPEGGDLVSGVQNRVFYRVRSKNGAPISSDGNVMLFAGKNGVVDSSYHLGMGYLDFTPTLREAYTVRITTPGTGDNVTTLTAPFASLGIRTSGVVLQVADPGHDHAPRAVGVQGDPIRVTLRRQGPAARLFLVAHCRGQVVDQRWVEVKNEPVDVTLQPTLGAHGMIRVTAYEVVGDALAPIAERLVYRAPTARLDLSFTPNGPRFQPGRPNAAKIEATDETGNPAPAYLLTSIVDGRFQTTPRSLSAHFLLLNEVRSGADLDASQVLLRDSPESIQVLERFLGTHGWRRYVPAPVKDGPAESALVFSRENLPLETLQRQYQERVAHALTPIRTKALADQMRLQGERDSASAALNILTARLHDFETNVALWIRLGLGLAVLVLLAISVILLGTGAYRTIRGHKAPTAAFGSAFASLAACLGIYFAGHFLGAPTSAAPQAMADAANAGNAPDRAGLEERLALAPAIRHLHEQAPAGAFGVRRGQKEAEQVNADIAADKKADDEDSKNLAKALQNQLVMNLSRDRGESTAVTLRDKLANENQQKWFNQARAATQADVKGTEMKKPVEPKGKAAQDVARRLEYPYQHGANLAGDTLFWHPTLFLANGQADIRFDIPADHAATYRVLILGHGPTGRFGFFETRLDVPAYTGR